MYIVLSNMSNKESTRQKGNNRFKKDRKESPHSKRWEKIKQEIQSDNMFKQSTPAFTKRRTMDNTYSDRYNNSFIRESKPKPIVKKEFNLEKMCTDFPTLTESKNKFK